MDGVPLTAAEAWRVRDRILSDPRTVLLGEPAGFADHWRRTSQAGKIGPGFWTDAYLTSFCNAAGSRLITFDRALAAKKACQVHLLESE
jgi:hypothetical protein